MFGHRLWQRYGGMDRLSLRVVALLGLLLVHGQHLLSAIPDEDNPPTSRHDRSDLRRQHHRQTIALKHRLDSLDQTPAEKDELKESKAWNKVAHYLYQPHGSEQTIRTPDLTLLGEPQKVDHDDDEEEPYFRILQTGGGIDMEKERRVLFYGDDFVLGVSDDGQRYPPGPMLQDKLVGMGWTNARVISAGNRRWSAAIMSNNLRRDKVGLVESIKRVGPELVVLSAGAADVTNGRSNVDLVLADFMELYERIFLPETMVRYLLILGIPQWNISNGRNDFRTAVNQGLHETFATFFKRVTIIDPPFAYEPSSPNYNGDYYSETGYDRLADVLATHINAKFEEPLRILCYGDSITRGTNSDGPLAPYSDTLQATLADGYGMHVETLNYAIPGWKAIESYEGLYSHRLGLGNILNFRVMAHASTDMLILLLGTNDLRLNAEWLDVHSALLGHHEVAYNELVRHIIALQVPNNRPMTFNPFQAGNATALSNAQSTLEDTRISFVPFPFDYEDYVTNDNWSDGLHPSPNGYRILGESLAPYVWRTLVGTQRVFCYGDELTSGRTGGTDDLHPYAYHLESLLRKDSGSGRDVVVAHMGFGQMTALELNARRGSLYGLAQQLTDGAPMDVVILWVGAFDLLSGTNGYRRVFRAIRDLDQAAQYRGAKRTVIVGLPPPESPSRPLLRTSINNRLQTYAARHARTTYFPFPYDSYDETLPEWGPDGLPSSEGYLGLAEALYPVVDGLLEEVEPTPESR